MRALFKCSWASRPFLALSMVFMLSASVASAASIDWLPRIDASTNLPVNNGNVIEAVNSAGPELIINGITFKDGDFGDDITNSNLLDSFDNCCSDNGAPTGASANMATMLDSHRWRSGSPVVATLILEGLTVGNDYMIQTYFSDFRPGSFKQYVWAGDNASTSEVFTRGTTEDNWSFIGNFTADTDRQRVMLVSLGTRLDDFVNHDPGLSGYVLSAVLPGTISVPEPSSLLLVSMAVVGGFVVLQRRRRALPTCRGTFQALVALVTVTMVGATGAFAAPISWQPKIDASTNLPVNNGSVVEAVNVAGPAITINGIDFKEGDFGDDITNSNVLDSFPDCCSDNGAPTGASANMATMLDSHRWLSGSAVVATLRLEALTPGTSYQIQTYFSDFRPGSFKEYFWMDDLGNASEIFRRGTTVDNWSFIGTFTADVDMQNLHLVSDGERLDGVENHDPGLSGYVLSELAFDGDVNGDGDRDGADYLAIQRGESPGGTSDISIWQGNYATSTAVISLVPEPATAVSVVMAVGMILMCRSQRGQLTGDSESC